jgi:hypothetical protein
MKCCNATKGSRAVNAWATCPCPEWTAPDLAIERRVFIHINNTNPALLSDSDERRVLEAAGWEVAFDGMAFSVG